MKRLPSMKHWFDAKPVKPAQGFGDYLKRRVTEDKLPEQPAGQIEASPMKKNEMPTKKPSPYKNLPNWMKQKMRDPRTFA
jgi:hypothetical protein